MGETYMKMTARQIPIQFHTIADWRLKETLYKLLWFCCNETWYLGLREEFKGDISVRLLNTQIDEQNTKGF